jgi:hypothetical protein
MSKAVKIFAVYFISLLACSLIFNWFNISNDFQNVSGSTYRIRPIIIPTVIGGTITLRYTVPLKFLKIFLIVYLGLWILRYLILFAADNLGEVHLFNRAFRFDLIIVNYYKTASKLETPLPFVLFWFIYYFYTKVEKSIWNKED